MRLLGLGPLLWVLRFAWNLLRKLLGQSGSSTPRAFEYQGSAANESVEVVGESRRQDALWRIAGSREPVDGRAQPIRAQIRRERDNPADPHAVAVWAMAKDTAKPLHVGYLPRGSEYRKPLDRLEEQGFGAIRCDAYLIGGFQTEEGRTASLGVELMLPSPNELAS